jgi:hypothetical protein
VTMRNGLRSPNRRATSAALVESPHNIRCCKRVSAQSHTSPGRDTACSGTSGMISAFSSSTPVSKSSSSFGLKSQNIKIKIRFLQLETKLAPRVSDHARR